MLHYAKRIGQAILTFIIATSIAFVMYRMLPGGPVTSMVAQRFSTCIQDFGIANCDIVEIRREVERMVGINPNKPIPAAYVEFMQDLILHQEIGRSISYGEPVFDILFQAMPWSIFISIWGLVLGRTFNIFWGAVLAYKEGSTFDKAGTIFAMVGNSIPYYVAAIVSLAFLAYEYHLFPTGGRYPSELHVSLPIVGTIIHNMNITPGFNVAFMVGAAWHAALPIFTGFVLGINGLSMRGNAIRVMESDYIRVARLRGLSGSRIASRYVGRNAILPMYTSLMIGIASIFGSGIIMEMIFSYPAVGWYTFDALLNRDYPLLMGSFIFYTGITIIGIFIADVTYGFIDPRASGGGDREAY